MQSKARATSSRNLIDVLRAEHIVRVAGRIVLGRHIGICYPVPIDNEFVIDLLVDGWDVDLLLEPAAALLELYALIPIIEAASNRNLLGGFVPIIDNGQLGITGLAKGVLGSHEPAEDVAAHFQYTLFRPVSYSLLSDDIATAEDAI